MSKKIDCIYCKSKKVKFVEIEGRSTFIVMHKSNCKFLKTLMKNTIEV